MAFFSFNFFKAAFGGVAFRFDKKDQAVFFLFSFYLFFLF